MSVDATEQLITANPTTQAPGVELRRGALNLEADSRVPRGGPLRAVGWSADVEALAADSPPAARLVAARRHRRRPGPGGVDGALDAARVLLRPRGGAGDGPPLRPRLGCDRAARRRLPVRRAGRAVPRVAEPARRDRALRGRTRGLAAPARTHLARGEPARPARDPGPVRARPGPGSAVSADPRYAATFADLLAPTSRGIAENAAPAARGPGSSGDGACRSRARSPQDKAEPPSTAGVEGGVVRRRRGRRRRRSAGRVPGARGSQATGSKHALRPARTLRSSTVNIALEQDPRAVVQTGPGVPNWSWNSYGLGWTGPVKSDQTIRLWLVSPGMNRLLTLVRLLLMLLLAVRLLIDGGSRASRPSPAGAAAVAAAPPLRAGRAARRARRTRSPTARCSTR